MQICRHVGVTDYERVDQIRSFETYMDQSSWYSHFEAELPSLPFAAPTDHSTNAQDTDNEYIVRDISQDANDVSEEVNGDTLSRPSETVTKYSSYSFLSTDLSGYFFGSKSRSNSTRVHRSDTVASSSSAAFVTSSGGGGGVGGDESAVVGSKGTVTGSGLKVPVRSPLTTAGSFRLFASPDATVRDLSSTQYQQTINSSIIHTTPFSNSPPLSPESNRRLNDTVRAIFPSDLSTGNTANNSNKSTDSNKSMSSGVQIDPSVLLDLDAWLLLMAQKPARAYFIARLDERRSSNATLTSTQYEYLLCALHACLDLCQAQDDVQIAMRVANMANTFHVTRLIFSCIIIIEYFDSLSTLYYIILCGLT